MGKAAMCIQMLQILNSGKPYKISELAALLDTNERNIIEYRKELEEAGFYINSVPGRYGGYTLDSKNVLPSIQLLPEEKDSILGAYSYIANRTTFPKRKEFIQGMAKIFSRIDLTNQQYNEVTQLDGFSMFMSVEAINKIYVEFEQAIKEQKKVYIDYISSDNEVRGRNILPYKIFMYNHRWFVHGFCERVHDYRFFDFCRIVKMTVLDKKFVKDLYYNEHDYLDQFGMLGNTQYYHVKLKFYGLDAIYAKLQAYGKNQKIVEAVKEYTIIELDMSYKPRIIGFILYYRGNCEVLEPEWLKEEVKEAALKIVANSNK